MKKRLISLLVVLTVLAASMMPLSADAGGPTVLYTLSTDTAPGRVTFSFEGLRHNAQYLFSVDVGEVGHVITQLFSSGAAGALAGGMNATLPDGNSRWHLVPVGVGGTAQTGLIDVEYDVDLDQVPDSVVILGPTNIWSWQTVTLDYSVLNANGAVVAGETATWYIDNEAALVPGLNWAVDEDGRLILTADGTVVQGDYFAVRVVVDGHADIYATRNVVVAPAEVRPPGGGGGGGGGGIWRPPTAATPTPVPPTPTPVPIPTPEPGELCACDLFDDVHRFAWYHDAVTVVAQHGLFQGTAFRTFEPYTNMTRAMFVQVLANLEGVSLAAHTAGAQRFNDVTPGAWYYGAVQWAASNGVVLGVGYGEFAPNMPITREQMAVMLSRYAVWADVEMPMISSFAPFVDEALVSYWALDSVLRMQEAGIIAGRPGGEFDPLATANRAEVATIFARFLPMARPIDS